MTNTINKIMHNGDEFKFDTSSVSGITTTQPSNPTEGAMYYDTTNDVVKVYDGTNWNVVGDDAADINTKTFYLSSSSDLVNAQAGLDWYLAGKNPIFVLANNGRVLTVYDVTSTRMRIISNNPQETSTTSGYTTLGLSGYSYTISNGTITSSTSIDVGSSRVIVTNHDYSNPYTPQYNGSPATKKYVDDTVASAKSSGATAPSNPTEGQLWYDTTNDVLKVYDGTNWGEVGKEYSAGEGIEIGTVQDYSAMRGPAPTGYHIPQSSEWTALCGILTSTFGMDSNATTMGTYLKIPSAGLRSSSSSNVSDVGTYGRYWSSTASSVDYAYRLSFSSSSLNPQEGYVRTYGFPVRCFKDTSIIPDSNWTTLYQGTGSAGVFRNSSLGLISVSGDGTTWYTIQDKNLGATTVYNQGDTLTDANCGYFYQWGNNYGFPYSGTVTTSATQVDTSDYGPGNYYSSSTFITRSSSPYDRSSVSNNNLRGGTTGIVTLNNVITNTGVLSVNGQTGDVIVEEGDSKVFNISDLTSAASLATATEAYTYAYITGKNAIIRYNGFNYVYAHGSTKWAYFSRCQGYGERSSGIWTSIATINMRVSSGSITEITININEIDISSSAPASGTPNSIITFVI